MSISYSNKRSKTLTPLTPEVEEEMNDNNDFNSLPTKNAEGGDAAIRSFEKCMVHLNGYHDSGKIDDGLYLRALTTFQTEAWPRATFLMVVEQCRLTWLKETFGGGGLWYCVMYCNFFFFF